MRQSCAGLMHGTQIADLLQLLLPLLGDVILADQLHQQVKMP